MVRLLVNCAYFISDGMEMNVVKEKVRGESYEKIYLE